MSAWVADDDTSSAITAATLTAVTAVCLRAAACFFVFVFHSEEIRSRTLIFAFLLATQCLDVNLGKPDTPPPDATRGRYYQNRLFQRFATLLFREKVERTMRSHNSLMGIPTRAAALGRSECVVKPGIVLISRA